MRLCGAVQSQQPHAWLFSSFALPADVLPTVAANPCLAPSCLCSLTPDQTYPEHFIL